MKSLTPFLFSILLFLSVIQQAAAVYDPTVGRWLSRDPIGEMGADGTNLYGYVRNNPSRYIDSLGLSSSVYPGLPTDQEIIDSFKPSSKCVDALKDLAAALAEGAKDLAKYDPIADALGLGTNHHTGGPVTPGGHAKDGMQNLANIARAIRRVAQDCKNDGCGKGPKASPLPETLMRWMEVAK